MYADELNAIINRRGKEGFYQINLCHQLIMLLNWELSADTARLKNVSNSKQIMYLIR